MESRPASRRRVPCYRRSSLATESAPSPLSRRSPVPEVCQNAMFFEALGLALSEKQIPQVNEKTEEEIGCWSRWSRVVPAQGRPAAFGKKGSVAARTTERYRPASPPRPYDVISVYPLGDVRAYCCDLAQTATCDSQVPVKCPEYSVLRGFCG